MHRRRLRIRKARRCIASDDADHAGIGGREDLVAGGRLDEDLVAGDNRRRGIVENPSRPPLVNSAPPQLTSTANATHAIALIMPPIGRTSLSIADSPVSDRARETAAACRVLRARGCEHDSADRAEERPPGRARSPIVLEPRRSRAARRPHHPNRRMDRPAGPGGASAASAREIDRPGVGSLIGCKRLHGDSAGGPSFALSLPSLRVSHGRGALRPAPRPFFFGLFDRRSVSRDRPSPNGTRSGMH